MTDVLSRRTPAGVRTVAAFEATKGALVLLVGLGLLRLVHRDIEAAAVEIVRHFHLSPSSRYPHVFLKLAARINDAWLWAFAVGSAGYAALRFTEAYGLWHGRAWAEWLAAISGGIYVPLELVEVARKLTLLRLASLLVNLAIVAYMVALLWRRHPKQSVHSTAT